MTAESSGQDEPREHLRFAAYLQAFHDVPDGEELPLVSTVLQDPDIAMANGAVLTHLDRRASSLIKGPGYVPWAQAMASVVASRPFLLQRLQEWSLFRAIILDQPWSPDALAEASNWLQLKVTQARGTNEAAVVLAQAGRTKRIRNTARAGLARGNGD
jgi:hypothetical protein